MKKKESSCCCLLLKNLFYAWLLSNFSDNLNNCCLGYDTFIYITTKFKFNQKILYGTFLG